ncbi:MAG: phosphotransferase family protein [Anaerolineae bacterium]
MAQGMSTEVYRVGCDGDTLYLRLLPEAGASFAPEVNVHRLLLAQGARVPEVVYSEDCAPELQRSVMVVREISGAAVTDDDPGTDRPAVLAAAGRDLALVNRLPVQGFGWVCRGEGYFASENPGSGEALRAECDTYGEWALRGMDAAAAALADGGVLTAGDAVVLRRVVAAVADWAVPADGVLAHGDFDGSHIFHVGGAYSGIIDFGEIRGAEPTYDLGQFQIEHPAWLPLLLAGYREAAATPNDLDRRIHFSSLLIATRRVASWLGRGRPLHQPDVEAVGRALAALS